MSEEKKYQIVGNEEEGQMVWTVHRIDHKIRGDYLMAKFYDRGSIQLFCEALTNKGFIEVK